MGTDICLCKNLAHKPLWDSDQEGTIRYLFQWYLKTYELNSSDLHLLGLNLLYKTYIQYNVSQNCEVSVN